MREKLIYFERTRNQLVWLDNSTVANHGYLVCLVTCPYDPAVFYTNEEYKVNTGKNVNIQKEIERPELHLIARCGSSDHEQLLYAEARLQCIQDLSKNIEMNGIEYTDKLRFIHGDSRARGRTAGRWELLFFSL